MSMYCNDSVRRKTVPCKQCSVRVPDTFEAKMEHIYYEHTDRFVAALLTAVRPTNARDIGRKVAEYFRHG